MPRSSSTAKTLPAANVTSCASYLEKLITAVHEPHRTEINVDSTAQQTLSTSVKESEERLNKGDLAVIRQSFDDGYLNAVN